jgi:peptidoglycan/LPS O-acetylase OafA/YrhL
MGFTWAAALAAVGSVPRWVFGVNTDAPIPLVFGVFGFIAGVTFSALLVLTKGRRTFDQMSIRRFAGLGATGGLLLSALWANAVSLSWGEVLAIAPTFALACAVCASGSLALARRAVRRELPDSRGDIAEAELPDREKRNLLGGGD